MTLTIAIGIFLVIVVVYFFLGNFRSTMITGSHNHTRCSGECTIHQLKREEPCAIHRTRQVQTLS